MSDPNTSFLQSPSKTNDGQQKRVCTNLQCERHFPRNNLGDDNSKRVRRTGLQELTSRDLQLQHLRRNANNPPTEHTATSRDIPVVQQAAITYSAVELGLPSVQGQPAATVSIMASQRAGGISLGPASRSASPNPTYTNLVSHSPMYDQLRLKHALEEIDVLRSEISSKTEETAEVKKQLHLSEIELKKEQELNKVQTKELMVLKQTSANTVKKFVEQTSYITRLQAANVQIKLDKKQAIQRCREAVAEASKLRRKLAEARETQKDFATKRRRLEQALSALQYLVQDEGMQMDKMRMFLEQSFSASNLEDSNSQDTPESSLDDQIPNNTLDDQNGTATGTSNN